jgi:hypothetical protein
MLHLLVFSSVLLYLFLQMLPVEGVAEFFWFAVRGVGRRETTANINNL